MFDARVRRWVRRLGWLASLWVTTGAATLTPAPSQALQFDREVVAGNDVVIGFTGPIVDGDAQRFTTFLRTLPAADVVRGFLLDSPGGSLEEAAKLIQVITGKGWIAVVDNNAECASACFLLFASASKRVIAANALIGVHSASEGGQDTNAAKAATTDMARLAAALGVPPAIIGLMVQTPPGRAEWLTPQQLTAWDVTVSLDTTTSGSGGITLTAPNQTANGASTQAPKGNTGSSGDGPATSPPAAPSSAPSPSPEMHRQTFGPWTLVVRRYPTSSQPPSCSVTYGGSDPFQFSIDDNQASVGGPGFTIAPKAVIELDVDGTAYYATDIHSEALGDHELDFANLPADLNDNLVNALRAGKTLTIKMNGAMTHDYALGGIAAAINASSAACPYHWDHKIFGQWAFDVGGNTPDANPYAYCTVTYRGTDPLSVNISSLIPYSRRIDIPASSRGHDEVLLDSVGLGDPSRPPITFGPNPVIQFNVDGAAFQTINVAHLGPSLGGGETVNAADGVASPLIEALKHGYNLTITVDPLGGALYKSFSLGYAPSGPSIKSYSYSLIGIRAAIDAMDATCRGN